LSGTGIINLGKEAEANRLQYASARTKIELIRVLAPLKLLTRNEAREIMNLPGVEGGDEFMQSLNNVSDNIADMYQMGVEQDEGKTDM